MAGKKRASPRKNLGILFILFFVRVEKSYILEKGQRRMTK